LSWQIVPAKISELLKASKGHGSDAEDEKAEHR